MLSREQVIWLYRCLLHRDPESDDVISFHMQGPSFEQLRSELLKTEECEVRRIEANLQTPIKFQKDTSLDRRQRIALAAIVKNEAFLVRRMLLSALPIVNFCALLDTGSTDNTIQIATEVLQEAGIPFAIQQTSFTDFSSARNKALDLVPSESDWILMLDADEYISSEDYCIFSELTSRLDVEVWQLPRYNFIDEQQVSIVAYPDYQRRLIQNKKQIRFIGHVHESLEGVRRWGFASVNRSGSGGPVGGPHIFHTPHLGQSHARLSEKLELYRSFEVG